MLILAPHPDDEIVACGIAAMRARAAGSRVFVLYLTTGVPDRSVMWRWQRAGHTARVQKRRQEALAAAGLLGIEPVRFRDTPARRLRFDLDRARRDIEAAIAARNVVALWVPAFEGAHQDHDAANALAATFARQLPVWEFAAYNFAGAQVRSNIFAAPRAGDRDIQAAPAEQQRKRAAFSCYASERGNLAHVEIVREAYRPLSAYDYGSPPHRGRLFRERFRWVPFRHPRVDFDDSAAVYRDIAAWVSRQRPASRLAPLGERPGDQAGQADRIFPGALDEAERECAVGR
jgi:LmbE family N-acetylglucosaminyl deacetylase